MPKVSIIIPVYNVSSYLKECMESVIHQTLKEMEIICVNDGSTDNCLEILTEYAAQDSRIRIVDKENEGYGKAMNVGIDAACGEFIGIVEPDDYVRLDMFEMLYNTAVEHDLDLVKADYYKFISNGTEGDRSLQYVHLSTCTDDYRKVFCPLEKLESFRFMMNTWAGIYRRSFVNNFQIRHHESPGAAYQDNGFWFQTFVHAKRAMILDQPMYRLRRDNPNSSTNDKQKIYAMNKEYDFIRGILMKDPDLWKKIRGTYWMKRFQNYNVTLARIDSAYIQEYREQIARELSWGYARGEFTRADFDEDEWKYVQILMKQEKSPQECSTEAAQARAELALVMNSASFRAGRAITWLPRRIRSAIRPR